MQLLKHIFPTYLIILHISAGFQTNFFRNEQFSKAHYAVRCGIPLTVNTVASGSNNCDHVT